MDAGTVIKYIDIGLACLAGFWGLILLFRSTSPAWKWVALAALIWALTACLSYFIPVVWKSSILDIQVFYVIQRLGIGLCLFVGMISAR